MGNFGSKLCGKGCLSSDEGKACVEVDTRVPSRKQPSHTAPATALSKKDEELCQSPGINELSIEFTDLSKVSVDRDSTEVDNSFNGSRFDVKQSLFLGKENDFVFKTSAASTSGDDIKEPDVERPIPVTPPVPEGFSGFPNGNSKYNERKGITAFSTPFEERIEKALRDQDDNI